MEALRQDSFETGPPRPPSKLEETRRWVKRADKLARWIIVGGGIGVIVAVLLILILIGAESVPIWRGAKGRFAGALRFPTAASDPILMVFSDAYGDLVRRPARLRASSRRSTARRRA